MKGDFTRSTFNPGKHYRGVRMQQGRVQLDADWNENLDILLHRIETETIDVIGECGMPVHNAGFEVVTDFDKLSQPEKNWLFTNESITPGVITYLEGGVQRIYAFVRGGNGHLFVRWWDGSWHWSDQGTPSGTTVASSPGVTTFVDGNNIHRIYAFVQSANGHLFVNWWDGSWHWSDQGTPPGTVMTGTPAVITYMQGGTQFIFAFVRGANGHLFVNWWDGSWHWSDQGTPPDTTMTGTPGVITYLEGSIQRIYAFVQGANLHLHVNWWDGSWHWSDQGMPADTTVASSPGVITYLQGSTQRIYAFVQGANLHLYVNWWDGSWHWSDQGAPIGPTGTMVEGTPGVITYLEGSIQRIYAFVRGLNGHLVVNWWDGSWHWSDQSTPAETTVAGVPGVITYLEGGKQRIYAFVRGLNGHLFVNWWDGSWHWSDQGMNTLMLQNGDFYLTQGRAYVDGILIENEHTLPFSQQPFLLPKDAGQINEPGIYILYLDVWERHITALEDSSIREVALGGPDTATRTQVVWQARMDKMGEINANLTCANSALTKWTPGRLRARTHPEGQPDDPCVVPAGAGYKRLENQLYRVEIHNDSVSGAATFKWSRDNGSVVVKIEEFNVDSSTGKVRVSSLGRDDVLGLHELDWVEVLDDTLELSGKPGFLVQIDDIDREQLIVTLKSPINLPELDITNPPKFHPKLRRWDSAGALPVPTMPSNNGYLKLEDSGIEIKFEAGTLLTGDYWQIPARTVPGQYGDIEWPFDGNEPVALESFGITHHLCKLAMLTAEKTNDGISITNVEYCRRTFPPLTELPSGGGSCCSVTVGDSVNSIGDYTDIQEAINAATSGSQVCILPGEYKLNETVVIKTDGLTISGCGARARILGPGGKPAFTILAKAVKLEDLLVWSQPLLEGVIVVADTTDFRLLSCEFSYDPIGADKVNGLLNLVVQDTENVWIIGNRFYAGGIWLEGTKKININDNQFLEASVWFGAASEQVQIHRNHLSGGGIWVADYSQEVEICDNHILGSQGPGIILGGLPAGYLVDLPAGSAIQEVTIVGNNIQDAMGSGIATAANHGFVDAVFIHQNHIVDCAQQGPDKEFDMAAVGGIVLHSVSEVNIHSNQIVDSGEAKEIPACGIFVNDCSGLEITDNMILNNGTKSAQSEHTTFQAGIIALFVHSEPGFPAVRIHDNVVVCPKGQALIIVGSGAMSITDNTLTSQGVLSQPWPSGSGTTASDAGTMWNAIGTCILVFNLSGTSLPSPSTDKNMDGRVLFHGNQVKNQGLVEFQTISVAVISQDDVSMQDNQFLMETIDGVAFTSVVAAGVTVRASSNRFQDTTSIFSYYSYGNWNIATGNQATHCIKILGPNNQIIDRDNQVLKPVAGICDPIAQDTQLFKQFSAGVMFHQESTPDITSTNQNFVEIVPPGKG